MTYFTGYENEIKVRYSQPPPRVEMVSEQNLNEEYFVRVYKKPFLHLDCIGPVVAPLGGALGKACVSTIDP